MADNPWTIGGGVAQFYSGSPLQRMRQMSDLPTTVPEIPNQYDVLVCLNIRRSTGRHWHTVRAQFLAIDPPFLLRKSRHSHLTALQRRVLYDAQGGLCAYCGCTLLPLNSLSDPELCSHRRSPGSSTTFL